MLWLSAAPSDPLDHLPDPLGGRQVGGDPENRPRKGSSEATHHVQVLQLVLLFTRPDVDQVVEVPRGRDEPGAETGVAHHLSARDRGAVRGRDHSARRCQAVGGSGPPGSLRRFLAGFTQPP